MLNVTNLRSGDLIFSTSGDAISHVIKTFTRSRFSHVCIYLQDGVIIESNEFRGVAARRIELMAQSADASVLGLPYNDWTSLHVLRHSVAPEEWDRVLHAVLPDEIGMDFPPPSVMARGGGRLAALAARPFGMVYEAWQYFRNREPVRYDCWCSRLVGKVLAEQFGYDVMTVEQRAILQTGNPQTLFEMAPAMGYVDAPECISSPVEPGEGRAKPFDVVSQELWIRQQETYRGWEAIRDQQRKKILDEDSLRQMRLIKKGLLVISILLIAALVAFALSSRFGRSIR